MDLGEITFGHSGSSGHKTNVTFALALILSVRDYFMNTKKSNFLLKRCKNGKFPEKLYTQHSDSTTFFPKREEKKGKNEKTAGRPGGPKTARFTGSRPRRFSKRS
jgi:hypothetical protein